MTRMRKKIAALLGPAIIFLLSGGMFSTVAGGVGMPAPEILGQSWLNSEALGSPNSETRYFWWSFGLSAVTTAATLNPTSKLGISDMQKKAS